MIFIILILLINKVYTSLKGLEKYHKIYVSGLEMEEKFVS